MSPRATSALLWLAAAVLMLSSAVYQRLTGPTHPERGTLVVEGQPQRYRLLRSEETVRDARIAVPAPRSGGSARMHWRRFPTQDAFQQAEMALEILDDGRRQLAAYLPAQPAAGKVEYRLEVDTEAGVVLIPAGGDDPDGRTIVLRFRDPVPAPVLIAHVAFMFFGMLVGVRAALGAAFAPRGVGRLAWTALGMVTVGGMILGPIVQKHAFGAYWTGFPFGYDLTDNKTLIMWVAWIAACALLGWKARAQVPSWRARAAVVAAGAVMILVYLIPHSLRGSELDYGAVDSGVPAEEAVRTGG
jgi:hypothetical protein